MNNEYLSNQELSRLTGGSENSHKSHWLKLRSIPHQQDGKRIIVSREHVRDWLAGKVTLTRSGMNLNAIR